jgi:hypothetical protein
MIRRVWAGGLPAVLLVVGLAARGAEPRMPLVEPSELTRRPELVGRYVTVDDRVRIFQSHRDRDYDEILLKRTPVVFRLPPHLRFKTAPPAAAVRLQGLLKREGDQWFCDVTALELLSSDLERLEQAVALLAPRDARGRSAWARWAEQRGSDFKDEPLISRARVLETEALRIEADEAERSAADPPGQWLDLARRARQRQVPEPEPSALAHRGLAARFKKADTVAAAQALLKDVEELLPRSPQPGDGEGNGRADLDAWLAPYALGPDAAYRTAPEPVRAALDHRIWADATQRLAELRMAAEPEHALAIAQDAADALKDRPQVATRLIEQGLKEAERNLATLRQGDVDALARVYRETLHREGAARDLLRRWLDDQRDRRLSATDAEGRVILADQYVAMLGAREQAVALLRDAWKIDPQSREVADAFRRFGFRKLNDQWVESAPGSTGSEPVSDPASAPLQSAAAGAQSANLRGLTPQQVQTRLGGKPDRVVRTATQGQLIEQWIYYGVNQDQYLNFLHTPGESVPKLVAYYARPRSRPAPQKPR